MDLRVTQKLDKLEKSMMQVIANMLTKQDAKNFVTKNDIANMEHRIKKDMDAMENRITEDICGVVNDLMVKVDEIKANREDVLILEKRVTKLERKALPN